MKWLTQSILKTKTQSNKKKSWTIIKAMMKAIMKAMMKAMIKEMMKAMILIRKINRHYHFNYMILMRQHVDRNESFSNGNNK